MPFVGQKKMFYQNAHSSLRSCGLNVNPPCSDRLVTVAAKCSGSLGHLNWYDNSFALSTALQNLPFDSLDGADKSVEMLSHWVDGSLAVSGLSDL